MQFQDDVAAGVVLVRPAIQSPDYLTGVSGWAIKIDGSAEFNDVVIRGGTTLSGISLYYDGTPALGNLVASIAAAAGTDDFGNAYAAGITTYSSSPGATINQFENQSTWNDTVNGSGIQITVAGGSVLMEFEPNTVAGVTWDHGAIGAGLANRLGTNTPTTFVSSPKNTTFGGTAASISLYGYPQTSIDVSSEAIIDAARTWVTSSTAWITGAWTKQSETWHNPTFAGTWATTGTLNGNSTFQGMQYRKDAEDNVWISGGAVSSGAVGTIFTLPAGYFHTTRRHLIPCWIFDSSAGTVSAGFAQVTETGAVNIAASLTGVTIATGDQVYINGKFPLGNIT